MSTIPLQPDDVPLKLEPAQPPRGIRWAAIIFQCWRWIVAGMLCWAVVAKAVSPKHLRGVLRYDGLPENMLSSAFLVIVLAEVLVIALLLSAPRSRAALLAVFSLFTVFTVQLAVFLFSSSQYPGFCGCGLPTFWDGKPGVVVGVVRNLLVLGGAIWASHRFAQTESAS